ncbi:MAG: alpha/beta fold hydrolase [Pseudomonadota bacterium]
MYTVLDAEEHQSKPPAWLYAASEPARIVAEAFAHLSALPMLLNGPRGDGHTVMTLPGFMASDLSTVWLRRLLRQLNYDIHPWLLGRNTGRIDLIDALTRRFLTLSDAAHGEKISLVGQSLGGVLARELAREYPDRVRMVITLGSPFGLGDTAGTNPLVQQVFERVSAHTAEELRDHLLTGDPAEPPPVPCAAIYSRTDGVVAWTSCLERDRPNTENIEVHSSHSGMAVQPAVMHAVSDRLAQSPSDFRRFERHRGVCQYVFPKPAYAAG